MRGKAAGTQRERAVRDWYRDNDFIAFRAPASLGCADVVAMRGAVDLLSIPEVPDMTHKWRRSLVELCEVKSTAAGPYHSFGPNERARLSEAARMAGARAVLAWWPPRGKLVFLYEDEWPVARAVAAA